MSTNEQNPCSQNLERQDAKFAKYAKEKKGRREPSPELDRLAQRVIGVVLEVHTILGPGFLEHVYEEAVCIELGMRGLRYQRQMTLPVEYKGRRIGESRLDLLVEEELVLELKAVEELRPVHLSQLVSYLRAGEFQLGLLINFNVLRLRDGIRRRVWTG